MSAVRGRRSGSNSTHVVVPERGVAGGPVAQRLQRVMDAVLDELLRDAQRVMVRRAQRLLLLPQIRAQEHLDDAYGTDSHVQCRAHTPANEVTDAAGYNSSGCSPPHNGCEKSFSPFRSHALSMSSSVLG